MEAFIDDGYTRTVRINGSGGPTPYPACTFTYRPLRGPEAASFEARLSRARFVEADEAVERDLQLAFVAERITAWDLTRNGRPTEPDKGLVGMLPAPMFARLLAILLGSLAPDEDLTGNLPASDAELEVIDEKNSAPG